ncbi:MAG: crotonase/enoyl-CoA hydratase family protein [Actinomycetota bacterium]|nr:crotonase/enoyl-CoA hydratase family protein [Actinomycetota bacterium]
MSSATHRIKTESFENILVVTIARPDRRNAVDSSTAQLLHDAFQRFEQDPSLWVAILTGAGSNFCAGADLKAMSSGDQRDLSPEAIGPMGPTRMRTTKPTIAAIEGYAVAGGLELALWCDLRIAADSAVLGVFCRRFGVPLIDLGTIRLPRLIGHSRAMDMILTGRGVSAQEALGFGLVNRVVPDSTALDAALEMAGDLCRFPQLCMRGDRLSAIQQWDLDEQAAWHNELDHGLATIASGETGAGAASFSSGTGRHGAAATSGPTPQPS